MTAKTKTHARKSIEERLEDFRARLHDLEKRKVEQDRRELHKLKLRLGTAAVAAGFSADWTDAQLERAMASAVKTREGSVKPATPKPEVETSKAATTQVGTPIAKAISPPKL